MDSALDYWSARALLEWQVELGATDALCEAPVDRYALEDPAPKPKPGAAPAPPPKPKEVDPVEEARKAARVADSLAALRAAMEAFSHCELKLGARNLVFSAGAPGARVMLIGDAPNREEDRSGLPFAGQAGALLERMLAAIDLERDAQVYMTNVLPWRPPQGRDPTAAEIAMLTPFLERHVALAEPEVLVLMGNVACQAVRGKRGLSRLRGKWEQAWGKPVVPMYHPADLLRQPRQKRLAWADLLALRARLDAVS